MSKPADPEFPIHELLVQRWSPRSFLPEIPSDETLHSLFEAARWAPSCFNEQPWNFVVGKQGDPTFAQILGVLAESNQRWAGKAPILILTVVSTQFKHNNNPNSYARHDLGLAVGQLLAQATHLGLSAHQMAGLDRAKGKAVFEIPDPYEVVSCIALGQPGPADVLPEDLRTRELAPRTRKTQADFVFSSWGKPLLNQ
jgi:nitroreductase